MTTTSTDAQWIEEFVVELRLRDVPGRAIGDAVARARELLADSGQSADEAFGSAREYAAALDTRTTGRWAPAGLMPSAIGLLAFLAFTTATTPWLQGTPVLFSAPQVALLLVIVLLVVALPFYLATLLRRPWLSVPLILLGAAAGALSAIVAPTAVDDAWLTVAPLPLLIVTAIVMLAGSIWSTTLAVKHRDRDTIVEPLQSPAAVRRGRGWSGAFILVYWLFPIYAGVMVAVSAALLP